MHLDTNMIERGHPVAAEPANPRLLIANNMPAHYRTAPYAALIDYWARQTSGSALTVYQVRRDPRRRGEWFFSPDDAIPYRHHYLGSRSFAFRGMTLYPPRSGRRLISAYRPTHVLLSGWDSPLSLACVAFARSQGSRLGVWIESNPSTSKKQGWAANRFRRAMLSGVDFVLTPTHESAQYATSLAGREVPVLRLPNPVSLQRTTVPGDGARRLVFVGDLSHRKGFDVFVRTVALGARLGWCGLAWGTDVEGLAASAPTNCTVSTGVPFAEICSQLREDDIWLIPSRRDPAPLTYSEALAMGIRVVVSTDIAYARHACVTEGAAVARTGDAAEFLRAAIGLSTEDRPGTAASAEVGVAHWAARVGDALLGIPGSLAAKDRAPRDDRGWLA